MRRTGDGTPLTPKSETSPRVDELKVPPAAPGMRIGLLGGSFNPAHAAHRRISLAALKRLGLDQVWWLVSPRNPLKGDAPAPDLSARTAMAREVARHPKIVVTAFEAARRSPYTVDTVRYLQRRFPSALFVWLMGADNLASLHRWREWEELVGLLPIAVFDRPGYRLKARASRAAQRFSYAEIDETDGRGLAQLAPPAWTLLTVPLSPLSSTALRERTAPSGTGKERSARKAEKKAEKKRAKDAKSEKKAARKGENDTRKNKKKGKRH